MRERRVLLWACLLAGFGATVSGAGYRALMYQRARAAWELLREVEGR